MNALADRVHQLAPTAPLERPSVLFLAGVSIVATLLTIGISYAILSIFRARRKREKERNTGDDDC